MGTIIINRSDVERAFILIRKDPTDSGAKQELLVLLSPSISVVAAQYSASDAGQRELEAAITHQIGLRADAMAERWLRGRMFLAKEVRKVAGHVVLNMLRAGAKEAELISAEEIKLDPLLEGWRFGKRTELLKVYATVCARIRTHFDGPDRDRRLAERCLRVLMFNRRPKWKREISERWGRARLETFKELYSMVLAWLRYAVSDNSEALRK